MLEKIAKLGCKEFHFFSPSLHFEANPQNI